MFAFVFLSRAAWAQTYTIATVAGGALPARDFDATAVSIGKPGGISASADGTVYFTGASVIFRLDRFGHLRRVAGTAGAGLNGDGGPATQAQLSFPRAYPYDALDFGDVWGGVAVGSDGTLYIADMQNSRMRKVGTDGIITTVSGTVGLREPSGAAADASGNAFGISAWATIVKISSGGDVAEVPGTGFGCGKWPTTLQCVPAGAAIDLAGNLYIADSGHCRIQKLGIDGSIVTIAGDARSDPRGFAYSCGKNATSGPATSAALGWPNGVAVDAAGNVYIADTENNLIRKVDPMGMISTMAGTGAPGYAGDGGPATSAQLNRPYGVTLDLSGNLYIADTDNFRIRKVSADGIITTVAGNGRFSNSGDEGPATSAQLDLIYGMTSQAASLQLDADGSIHLFDAGNGRRRITPDGMIHALSETGGPFNNDIVDADGNRYYANCCYLMKASPTGALTTLAAIPSDPEYLSNEYGPFLCPFWCPNSQPAIRSVALDGAGNIYFNNATNIFRRSPDGTVTSIAGTGSYGYSGDGGPATQAQLTFPSSIAVDGAGNIYVADGVNNAIRILTAAPQPGPLSITPGVVKQGECYTIAAGHGSNMTLHVQYSYEGRPAQTLWNWPALNGDGRSEPICTSAVTPPGTYTITAIRNSANPNWIPVSASITVKAANP
jgi:sugar lactone lactonase YvrE